MKAKKTRKPLRKTKPAKAKSVKAIVLNAPEVDEDLRMILNKSDFDKYELDTYLNDFR